jgi:nitrogen fixation protein NifU and related proteins
MSASEQLYQDLVMDRARNPRHAGRLPVFDAEGEGDNPMCGDRVHVFLNREATEVSHESQGCAIMIASADLMADAVAGADISQIKQLRSAFEAAVNSGKEDPSIGNLNALGPVSEYRSRIRCAILPWSALEKALEGVE